MYSQSIVIILVVVRFIIILLASANLLLTMLLRILFARKAIKVFGANIPAWRVIGFELMVPWRKMRSYFRYIKTDKYEFTSHKL